MGIQIFQTGVVVLFVFLILILLVKDPKKISGGWSTFLLVGFSMGWVAIVVGALMWIWSG